MDTSLLANGRVPNKTEEDTAVERQQLIMVLSGQRELKRDQIVTRFVELMIPSRELPSPTPSTTGNEYMHITDPITGKVRHYMLPDLLMNKTRRFAITVKAMRNRNIPPTRVVTADYMRQPEAKTVIQTFGPHDFDTKLSIPKKHKRSRKTLVSHVSKQSAVDGANTVSKGIKESRSGSSKKAGENENITVTKVSKPSKSQHFRKTPMVQLSAKEISVAKITHRRPSQSTHPELVNKRHSYFPNLMRISCQLERHRPSIKARTKSAPDPRPIIEQLFPIFERQKAECKKIMDAFERKSIKISSHAVETAIINPLDISRPAIKIKKVDKALLNMEESEEEKGTLKLKIRKNNHNKLTKVSFI